MLFLCKTPEEPCFESFCEGFAGAENGKNVSFASYKARITFGCQQKTGRRKRKFSYVYISRMNACLCLKWWKFRLTNFRN